MEEQGFGWTNSHGSGKAGDTVTSGLEGAWTNNPVKWDNNFMENLHAHEWELTKSPAGKSQYAPKNAAEVETVPDAHDPSKKHAPMMLTTDLSLRMDPDYAPISKRFLENPADLEDAFAKAWFKLLHRDMGPLSRYVGPLVPAEPQLWQDPVPAVDHDLVEEQDVADLKAKVSPRACPFPNWSRLLGRRRHRSAAPTNAVARMVRASASPRKRTGK